MTILDEWRLIMSEEKNFAFEGIILENTIIHRDSLRPKKCSLLHSASSLLKVIWKKRVSRYLR